MRIKLSVIGLAFLLVQCSVGGGGGAAPDAGSMDVGSMDAAADADVDAAPAPDPSRVIQIIAGNDHACGLKESGGVHCWGSGEMGQLPGVSSTRPIEIAGLPRDMVQIAAGDWSTCGVTRQRTVRCWGSGTLNGLADNPNLDGQIGELPGLPDIEAVTIGNAHVCVLTTAKTVWCWGNPRAGALGNGMLDGEPQPPAEIAGLSDVQQISAGNQHTCALTTAGAVKCWGFNFSGQVGDGTQEDRATPVDVVGLDSNVAAIDAGQGFSCAARSDGEVVCWGSNALTQLGTGATPDESSTPITTTRFAGGVRALSGRRAGIAVGIDGSVLRWGILGFDLQDSFPTPEPIALPLSDIVGVADGGHFQCALSATGRAFCWGGGPKGQLGDGTDNESLTAVEVLW